MMPFFRSEREWERFSSQCVSSCFSHGNFCTTWPLESQYYVDLPEASPSNALWDLPPAYSMAVLQHQSPPEYSKTWSIAQLSSYYVSSYKICTVREREYNNTGSGFYPCLRPKRTLWVPFHIHTTHHPPCLGAKSHREKTWYPRVSLSWLDCVIVFCVLALWS